MSFSNPWFYLALLAIVGLYKLELISTLLNLSALRPQPPERLRDAVSQEDHDRMLEYARDSARFDTIRDSTSLGLLLAFWWAGGFGWLDTQITSLGYSPILTGLTIIGTLVIVQGLISLPFDVYDTFFLEARYGFNTTTIGTFLGDRVKGLLLAFILGAPLLALLLWLFAHLSGAALYGWLILTAFSLGISFIAPRWIMPLFFKFQLLQDPALKAAILELAQRLDFPVTEVSIVDGSRRSTKANAFFTGFGKNKRIALFDTLLKNHTQEEILAVLAHEIGHNKCRHIPRQMALSITGSGLMFLLLHFALHDPRLGAAFGVPAPSIAWSLVFFSIVYQPLSVLLSLLTNRLSRKYEFEADAYAKAAVGSPAPLVSALTRLNRDHLGNPTPHPLHIWLHHSHPPVLQRLAALESGMK